MNEMTTRLVKTLAIAPLAAAMAIACGGDSEQTPTACEGDTDCGVGTGLICADNGICGVLTCETAGDCLTGDQACIDVGGQSVCSAVECGCANCDICPDGETCANGSCVLGSAEGTCEGGTDEECPEGQVCDAKVCRDCAGDECGTSGSDCTVDGCEAGFECNTTTKACDPVSTVVADACDTCVNADECGGGDWKCAPLTSGNACLPPCANNDDCDTGWLCQAGNCTPLSYACGGCVVEGCEAGMACNPNNSTCVAGMELCGTCGNDWECGDGNACHNGTCVPRCVDGACASGGTCVTSGNQIQVCEGACQGLCDPACEGTTPHCVEGACVQCRDTSDCNQTNGETCNASGVCEGGTGDCTSPTPYFLNGGCVECVTNDHCGELFCNSQTNTCESDICSSCADPYPSCTQIGEDFYCVQCTEDADCGVGGTCNPSTFACEGGTVTNTDPCTSDADCDDGGVSGFTLLCDTTTGFCYDEKGTCDGVTAYCPGTLPSTGAPPECLSMMEAFAGGALPSGGLPGGGGTTLPGYCACEYTGPAGMEWLSSTCQSGSCMDLAALMALLGGGTAPSGQSGAFCFSLGQ